MRPLILVPKPKWCMFRIYYANPVCYFTAWRASCLHDASPHWQRLLFWKGWPLPSERQTSTMAARVCYINQKPTTGEETFPYLMNPLFELDRISLTGVSLDFTDSPGSWQEALWESVAGRVNSSSKHYVRFLYSHCRSWLVMDGPSDWFLPRCPCRAVRLSSWCSAHRAPWWLPSPRLTQCQQQR